MRQQTSHGTGRLVLLALREWDGCRVLRQHFCSEQLNRLHGLLMGEITPLKRAHKVIGASGKVFVPILTHRSGRTRQRHPAQPVGVRAGFLLVKTLQLGADITSRFPRWESLRTLTHKAERAIFTL